MNSNTSYRIQPTLTSCYKFKLVFGGAGAVGKTTLLQRYLRGVFVPEPTLEFGVFGVAFHTKEVFRSGDKVKLTIWDLDGQQQCRFMLSDYSAGARAAVVCFDASRPDTIDQVDDLVSSFRAYGASPDLPIVLCGNKVDLIDARTADHVHRLGKEIAAGLGLTCYLPTSAKTGENVETIFTHIIDTLLSQIEARKIMHGKSLASITC